jgi:hypothetical protein
MSIPSHLGHVDGSDTVAVAPSVWLRNRRRTRAWAALSAAWSILFACLVFLPGRLPANGLAGETIVLIAFYFGIGSIGLMLARRVARAGVWIGPDGIVVRGPFRTQSVALGEAGRFGPGLQGRGGNGVPCPMLERQGRAAAGVWALGRRNVWFRYARICEELQPLCDDLNELVDALRPSDLTGRSSPSTAPWGSSVEIARALTLLQEPCFGFGVAPAQVVM